MAEVTQAYPGKLPKGVTRTSWGNRWFVQLRHRGQRYYLGTFGDPEEASQAYQDAKAALVARDEN